MQRPTSVIVFGVLNLLFGTLGLCTLPFLVLIFLTLFQGKAGEHFAPIGGGPVVEAWYYVSSVLNVLGTFVLLATGIGLLMLWPWARVLSIIYAIYGIVSALAGVVVTFVFVLGPMLTEARARGGGPDVAAAIGGAIGGAFGAVIGLVYSGLLWYYMTRPHVIAAFRGIPLPQPAEPDMATIVPPPVRAATVNPFASPVASGGPAFTASGDGGVVETLIPARNAPALASYYLGIFSLFPLLGLPLAIAAVVLGIRGLRKVNETPEVRGRVHAWVGVVCGTLFGLFNTLLVAAVVLGLLFSL